MAGLLGLSLGLLNPPATSPQAASVSSAAAAAAASVPSVSTSVSVILSTSVQSVTSSVITTPPATSPAAKTSPPPTTLTPGVTGASPTVAALTDQDPVNLGPLTVAFSLPPACTAPAVADCATCTNAFLAQSCDPKQGRVDATSCWPATSSGAPKPSSGSLHGWGYYSPGLACPTGYATACSATGGAGATRGWDVQFRLGDKETAVGCCPTGFACANTGGQTCVQVATATTVPTARCAGGTTAAAGVATLPDAKASATALTLFAPMFQLNFQSTDLPARPKGSGNPADGTAGSTADPTDGGSSSSSSTTTTAPGSSSGGGGGGTPIATGAVVGAAVGGAGALVVLISGCFLFWRRRRQTKEREEAAAMSGVDLMYEETRPRDGLSRYFRRPPSMFGTSFGGRAGGGDDGSYGAGGGSRGWLQLSEGVSEVSVKDPQPAAELASQGNWGRRFTSYRPYR